jgi:hypothetical protein
MANDTAANGEENGLVEVHADLKVYDAHGILILQIEDLSARNVNKALMTWDAKDLLYQLIWEPLSQQAHLLDSSAKNNRKPGAFLVVFLESQQAAADCLLQTLSAEAKCLALSANVSAKDLTKQFADILDTVDTAQGVTLLSLLPMAVPEPSVSVLPSDCLLKARLLACDFLVVMTTALVERGIQSPIIFSWSSYGEFVLPEQTVFSTFQAVLWGFTRTLRQEQQVF